MIPRKYGLTRQAELSGCPRQSGHPGQQPGLAGLFRESRPTRLAGLVGLPRQFGLPRQVD
jgi:hypothetical protein